MIQRTITAREYGFVAKSLHWLIFLLLAAQYIVGAAMPHITRRVPDEGLVAWHLSIGMTILFVIVARLGWRLAHTVPLPTTIPAWQRLMANITHSALYLLLIVMTVLGWANASFQGWSVRLFGFVALPPLAAKGTPWAHTAGGIHNKLVYVLLGFIVMHVAGVLYHQFVRRDRLLLRMLPEAFAR